MEFEIRNHRDALKVDIICSATINLSRQTNLETYRSHFHPPCNLDDIIFFKTSFIHCKRRQGKATSFFCKALIIWKLVIGFLGIIYS